LLGYAFGIEWLQPQLLQFDPYSLLSIAIAVLVILIIGFFIYWIRARKIPMKELMREIFSAKK
jgi:hypothetical protein